MAADPQVRIGVMSGYDLLQQSLEEGLRVHARETGSMLSRRECRPVLGHTFVLIQRGACSVMVFVICNIVRRIGSGVGAGGGSPATLTAPILADPTRHSIQLG
jgi:hypothetical protein